MDMLSELAAHALHTAFITVQEVPLDWPKSTSTEVIPLGTIVNVDHLIITHTESHTDPFEVWVAVHWDNMPEQEHYTEWHFPLDFLTECCDLLEPDLEINLTTTH